MAEMYVNYGVFDEKANTFATINDELRNKLGEIEGYINGLESSWESNASTEIRTQITSMESVFVKYFDVVDNYVKFVRNAKLAYETQEGTNVKNATNINRFE